MLPGFGSRNAGSIPAGAVRAKGIMVLGDFITSLKRPRNSRGFFVPEKKTGTDSDKLNTKTLNQKQGGRKCTCQ